MTITEQQLREYVAREAKYICNIKEPEYANGVINRHEYLSYLACGEDLIPLIMELVELVQENARYTFLAIPCKNSFHGEFIKGDTLFVDSCPECGSPNEISNSVSSKRIPNKEMKTITNLKTKIGVKE